jgi:hypothetical protein
MNVLILDDQDIRHELAEKILTPAGVKLFHAFDCVEGFEIIGSHPAPFALALLNHDLMDIVEEEDGRKTEYYGAYFVDYTIANIPRDKWFARAIVHSYNATGGKYMVEALKKNGIPAYIDNFSGDMLKRVVRELSVQ